MRVSDNVDMKARRAHANAPEVVAAIVALREAGASQQKIARELKVSQAHVCRILRGSR